jgi:chromosomal replication initiator protein
MFTQMDNKQLWNSVLVEIELNVSKAAFATWFKDTHILRQEEGTVYVGVPNQFVKDWLSTKYHKFIVKALREQSDAIRSIEYVISSEKARKKEEVFENYTRQQVSNELPLGNFYINKEDNLNPRYDFDSFVIGPFNELAYAASQAVIAKPGSSYNPLFIYGHTGHGKTHLIQAIGNKIKKNKPDAKVFYLTSEKFAIDYINSVQMNKVNMFKEKYRKYDVLIMDDIQFLSNKEKSQEELFHLFNSLYENNKQIIFSSDKHPNYIPHLEDRLKSRFAAGMIVDIPPPDRESRSAILKAKAKWHNCELRDDVVDYLASSIEGNIRELEGALNAIICHSQLKEKELDLAEVKNLVKNSVRSRKNISAKDLIKVIADFYNIDEKSIYEKTRKKEVVKPRQLIMYILREDFSISYPEIGQKLGGRDHTTVIHSCDKIRNDLKVNNSLMQELNELRAML